MVGACRDERCWQPVEGGMRMSLAIEWVGLACFRLWQDNRPVLVMDPSPSHRRGHDAGGSFSEKAPARPSGPCASPYRASAAPPSLHPQAYAGGAGTFRLSGKGFRRRTLKRLGESAPGPHGCRPPERLPIPPCRYRRSPEGRQPPGDNESHPYLARGARGHPPHARVQ